MDISLYLLIGLLIGGLLYCRSHPLLVIFTLCYWLLLLLWSAGLIHPFVFSPTVWVQLFNISFSYHIDGLSRLFVLLIAGIGLLVFGYAWFYTEKYPKQREKLFALLQIFAISMLGIVLANDMVMLFLSWELTSVTSFLLIQFDVTDTSANQAAFNSIFVSVLGGLILLVGFIFLNQHLDTWRLDTVIHAGSSLSVLDKKIAFSLILMGVITKSAQFPFYFWLTGAMKAPTPVSAYLHSATMVNAGIYLLARFHPLFDNLAIWYPVLVFFGLTTMTLSGILSVFHKDLKSILAYTTIFALGAMVYLLGGKDVLPIEAFAVFLLFHGIYKAAAFMLAGIIDKEYHTRRIDALKGILRARPFLAINVTIVFAAMAGLPPFFGFTVKEMIYEAKLASASVSYVLMTISIISSMLISAASFRCLWYLFKKDDASKKIAPIKKLKTIYLCPGLLVLCILIFSITEKYMDFAVNPAIQAIMGQRDLIKNTITVNTGFILGVVTVFGGVLLFYLSFLIKQLMWRWFSWLEIKNGFEHGFNTILQCGKRLTELTQGQSIEVHLKIIMLAMLVVLIYGAYPHLSLSLNMMDYDASMLDIFMLFILVGASISLLVTHEFLYNLVGLGVIGLDLSLFFITKGAVDVAITQLLVEVLTIIILLLAFRSTRKITANIREAFSAFNCVVSILFGLFVSFVLLNLNNKKFDNTLKYFYSQKSYLEAYGKNIVNVILVDFRSMDTFGEAMVIVATAIGVIILLKKHALRRS